jgi:peptidoglycan/xylan/chitin deacetylase (PgdA/CDA1 family)
VLTGLHQPLLIILSSLGIPRLAREFLARRGRFIVTFHGISSQRYETIPRQIQPHISRDELHRILSWLRRRFRFLTPAQFLETDLPGILLTFDDGFANNFTNALPILIEFGAPAIFFIATQHVIKGANWLSFCRELARANWGSEANVPADIAADFYNGLSPEQLRQCIDNSLITIGGHTETHPILTLCSPRQLVHELQASRQRLRELTDQPIDLFAYPKGEFNETVIKAVQAAGYKAAFALDRHKMGTSAFNIPRIGLYSADTAYLDLKLSGLYQRPLKGRLLTQDQHSFTDLYGN